MQPTRLLRMNIVAMCLLSGAVCAATFIRGDTNQDGQHNIADPITSLSYLFGGAPTTCAKALDANDDGKVDIADPIRVLDYLFGGGGPLPLPFPECGDDPTADSVSCDSFNDEVCGDVIPPLSVSSMTPALGPAAGGTPVVITGENFTAAAVEGLLCDVVLVNLTVVSDTRIEALTPAGTAGTLCDLRLTNGFDEALLPGAFTYEDEPPPECYSEDDLADLIDQQLSEPICIPSPAFEGELLGNAVVACPVGCCTCTSGEPGCEARIDSIETAIDLDEQTISGDFTASTLIPIDVEGLFGTTRCDTDIVMTGTAALEFSLAATQWDGVYEIADLSNLVLEITSLEVDSSGGIVCAGIELGAGELQDTLQEELNNYTEEFLEALRADLIGAYVCP